jgi:hypothetical protein
MTSNKNNVNTEIPSMKKRLGLMKASLSDIALKPIYTATNYVRDLMGLNILERQMDESIDQFHSPKARAKILRDNVAGIKTSFLNEHVKKANQSITTNLIGTLTRATTGFESLLQSLNAQLHDPAQRVRAVEKQNLLTKFQNALEPSRQPNDELNLFKLRMETLQELLETNAIDDPRVIVAYVKKQYEDMLKKLDDKKKKDLQLIDEQIQLLRTENATNTPPSLTDNEITTLTATLKKELEEAYDKTKQALDKDFKVGIPPDTKKDEKDKGTPSLFESLDKAVNQAEAELTNFVLFSEKSKSKTLLESGLSTGLGTGGDTQGRKYRDISFMDYASAIPARDRSWVSPTAWFQYAQFLMNNQGSLSTPSGLRIECTPNGISFTFPSGWALYHHSPDRLLGADLMIMVKDLVRQGCKEVTLTLNCDDPELRKKIMEEFYYCAHLNGFPDDKIKFNIAACPRARSEEDKKPIENKNATEIGGQLGRAQSRAQAKKALWDEEQSDIDKSRNIENNRSVQVLEERIDNIIGQDQPAIQAVGRYTI